MRKVPRSKIRCTPSLDSLEVRDLLSGMTGPVPFEPIPRPAAEFAPPTPMDRPGFDLVVGRLALAIDYGDFAFEPGRLAFEPAGPAPFHGPDGGWRAVEVGLEALSIDPGFGLIEAAPLGSLPISLTTMVGPSSIERSAAPNWLAERLTFGDPMPAFSISDAGDSDGGLYGGGPTVTSNVTPYPTAQFSAATKVGPQPLDRSAAFGWLDARRTSGMYPISIFATTEPIFIDYGGEVMGMGDSVASPMAGSVAGPVSFGFGSRAASFTYKVMMGRPMPKLPPMRDLFAVISLYEVGKPEPAEGELDTAPMVETVSIIPIGNMAATVAQALMGGERVVAQIGAPSTPEWIDTALERDAGANASVNLESLAWQLDAAPGAASAPPAFPAGLAEATPEDGEPPQPLEAGLITDFLPADLAALEESLSRFLDRFDELNPDLDEAEGFPTAPILIVSAFLTFEAARRYRNRRFLTGSRPVARERSSTLHGFS